MKKILMMLCFMPFIYIMAEENAEDIDWAKLVQNAGSNYDMKMKSVDGVNALNIRIDWLISDAKTALDEQAHKLLILNQESWVRYAKSKAAFISDSYRGGTLEGLSYGYAMIYLQKLRISEIKDMIKNYNEP